MPQSQKHVVNPLQN